MTTYLDDLDLEPRVRALVLATRAFVDDEVISVASHLDHTDTFPAALVARMQELGLFGLTIAEEHGGFGGDLLAGALVQLELGRGWVSLCGVLNPHLQTAGLIARFGTDGQRALLPTLATGATRAAFSITEPHAGSDVQAISTVAEHEGDGYRLTGHKAWVTNGLRAGVVTVLAKTDPSAEPRHRGMTAFVVEKEPGVEHQDGLTVRPPTDKLGYRGVESVDIVLDGFRVPAAAVLGGPAGIGRGMQQLMTSLEVGRIGVAARSTGIAQAAYDEAIRRAAHRTAFGVPIAEHQAVQAKLADMATRITASRLLTLDAVRAKRSGRRADLAAGMAKLFASETAVAASLEAMRIHGGAGYDRANVVERLYRDAVVLVLGEGSNEIQQSLIARRLLEDFHADAGAP